MYMTSPRRVTSLQSVTVDVYNETTNILLLHTNFYTTSLVLDFGFSFYNHLTYYYKYVLSRSK